MTGENGNGGRKARTSRRRRVSLGHRLRANFLTGLIVVVPVVVTLYLTWAFITFVDSRVLPLVPAPYNPRTYIDADIPGYGLIVFLIFTTVVGYFAKRVFGKQLIRVGEDFVDRMPVVRSIYNALKQLVETVLSQSKSSFRQACLIEYPRKGVWAIAFISTDTKGEILSRTGGREMVSVFLPTTPNPTSGFLMFIPKTDVIPLDMTIEEAAKLIISAGLVSPPSREEIAAEQARIARRKEQLARVAGASLNGNNDKG
ncbi:DUF502 domain-containing protein [Limibaculum sp. FT325]|uniref:DUF502 domain-containing protein n=1 Tax=Thermohalobaculum sediminis TaxID=2939436 RepID=UPI0020BD49CE|nr:DUF502 domain-containing protein [Limibaculum sediminis]MCL5778779.1 DUF502 domain-containing protein [Limibaculum sediminis]